MRLALTLAPALLTLSAAPRARADEPRAGAASRLTMLLGAGVHHQQVTREFRVQSVRGAVTSGALIAQLGVRLTPELALAVHGSIAGSVESDVVLESNTRGDIAHGLRYSSQPAVVGLSAQFERGGITATPRVGVHVARLSERQIDWMVAPGGDRSVIFVGTAEKRVESTVAIGLMIGVDLSSSGPHRTHLFLNGDANLGGGLAHRAVSLGVAFRR